MTTPRHRIRTLTRRANAHAARRGRRLLALAARPAAAAPPPRRGTAGPEAVYAAVLDGDRLWLAVSGVAEDARFLLETDDDEVPLVAEVTEPLRDGADAAVLGTSIRAELLDLPLPAVGPGEVARYRVLARDAAGARPLRLPAPRVEDVTTTPRASRGWVLQTVDRDEAGLLVLQRRGYRPWAEVLDLSVGNATLYAHLRMPADIRADAVLHDERGQVLASDELRLRDSPTTGPTAALTIHTNDLPLAEGESARLVLDERTGAQPIEVRRRHHQLTAPDAAVSLPGVTDGLAERPRLRWRWFPDGGLGVHRPSPAAGGR